MHRSHVLFPEQVLLVFLAAGSHSVVDIHEKVDEWVEHGVEGAETAGHKFDSEPPRNGHDSFIQ